MYNVNFSEAERLEQALKEYQGNTEAAINEVLHSSEVSELAYDEIKRLMPVSKKSKGSHAKMSKSLRSTPENLALIVRSAKAYQYLYFPDDGTNTRRHVGNQRFFARGAEAATGDIVERCIKKLTII